ncbi:ABC transporter ATP-binding protein [Salmonella enterica subsp. enterica]|nr:ATP-binding cassette domain-containing protein [Salmonella enterica subsp. enterica serovar Oranienburg]MLY13580.1 ABC transporter ATP-binding protein [Salmonella enterica subsp. enterica serovar Oranienburg]
MIVFSSLQIRRGVRVLLDNASATINPGQKVGLVGKNGCGKSTLLALLKNEISADAGSFTLPGPRQLAWVNQETPALPQPAIEYVIDGDREYRHLEAQLNDANERNDGHAIASIHGKLDAIDARTVRSRAAASLLHGPGFSNDQLERPVSDFSGGWRMRLNLAQALIYRSDLLLPDEPTNHLDLDMRQALTEALSDFEGALVVVSHDRHLIRSTTDNLYLVHDKKVVPFDGDLENYQQWLSDVQKQENQTDDVPKENANSAQARKDQKYCDAELPTLTQPLRKEIARLEKEMERLNAQLAQAEEKLGDSSLYDPSRKAEMTECLQQQASAKSGLEACEMAWLEAQERLEQMMNN